MKNIYHEEKLFELIKSGSFNERNCFEWNGPRDKDGYGITTISENDQKKTWKVHRVIYYLLRGEIPDNMLICHACDNPSCFNINHLFLGTALDNNQDREKKGRGNPVKGDKNKRAKLTQVEVLQIRKMYAEGTRICELVRIFKINQPTISKIVHRLRWKHI